MEISNRDVQVMYNDMIVRGLYLLTEEDEDWYNTVAGEYYVDNSIDTAEFIAKINHRLKPVSN